MSTSRPTFRRHARFHSAFLDDDRDVTVYLPPGYSRRRRGGYPVLYMHDGQNLFRDDEAFIAGESWRIGETADMLIGAGRIEPLLIVGIANAGERRVLEYTPTATKRLGGGQADRYGRMILEELQPLIDRSYATAKGPSRTGLGGSSLGGLVTLFLGLRHPGVFGRLAVLSPSVWWDRRVILRDVNTIRPTPRPRVWLDIGTGEGKRAVDDTRLLAAGMKRAGWTPGDDLVYTEHPGATHRESAWAARVGPMLQYLFPSTPATIGPPL
jgi:predicted alpha/beta superfamily hydrolase